MKKNIAIMTDFGLIDNYVALMKAVILNINPDVNIIDITHQIKSQNIKQAAFILQNSYKYFPDKTIFLVVVDPGVGSGRKAIAIQTKNYYFVGPDNGIFSYITDEIKSVIKLDNSKYHLKDTSSTFHGRDIFAPTAAYLSNNIIFRNIGSHLSEVEIIKIPKPEILIKENQIIGEIIYSDRFGNFITSINKKDILDIKGKVELNIGNITLKNISNTFTDVKTGDLLAYIGSTGYLEIGLRNGDATKMIDPTSKIIINY